MYQPSFRHALILSTVAHTAIGVACYVGGWFSPVSGAATSEPCDGNHIPHITVSLVSDIPVNNSKNESASGESEPTTQTEASVVSNPPPTPLSISEDDRFRINKEKPHYHHSSFVKKAPNKQVKKNISPVPSAPSTSESVQTNSAPGLPQSLASNTAVGGGSSEASPSYYRNPPPTYPEAARRMRREGLVRLFVTVEPNGTASSITISSSSGHQILDEAAIAAVQHWKFKPGEINGVAVQSKVEVPIRFALQ